jgi:hypothetical protein
VVVKAADIALNRIEMKYGVFMKTKCNKLFVGLIAASCLALGPAMTTYAAPAKGNDSKSDNKGKGKEKVTICHKGHTLTVSKSALSAHLKHGDTLGPCDVTPSKNR